MSASAAKKPKRIVAIDLLRGLTVAAMIVVNNGAGPETYATLEHSAWNGLTLCDMVFPSFLFIVGMSAYLSMSRGGFRWSVTGAVKILRRTVLILLIGWALNWLGPALKHGDLSLSHLRLTGVLPRISLCYFFVSVMALTFGRRTIGWIAALLLAGYGALLLLGEGMANSADNILVRADHTILGADHLYTKQPVDPEGLVSTLGSLAHTLIGFCCGALLAAKNESLDRRLLRLMAWGFAMLLAGTAVAALVGVNKRVWSPSFTLVTCGLVAMALGALAYLTEQPGRDKPLRFLLIYGVNPLFLYVLSEVIAIILSATGSKGVIYAAINSAVADPRIASAIYSFTFSAAFCLIGYPLYRRKIYIKI